MSDLDDIVREFLVESNEGLDQLDRDLIQLEREPDCGDLIARIFRSVHTIKGTGGVLGYEKLTAIAHVGENLLSHMRDGKLRLDSTITSALLGMADALRQVLGQIASIGEEGDKDYTTVVDAMAAILGGECKPAPKLAVGGAGLREVASDAGARLAEPKGVVSPSAPPPRCDEAAIDLVSANGESGPPVVQPTAPGSPTQVQQGAETRSTEVANGSIRVDVNLLDKLMNLVGELVLARNQILQYKTSLQDAGFLNTAQMLNLITTELQENVMKTRMQPIGNVWGKFPRIVRDLALSCGKKVELEMDGAETELDKTLLAAIKDPLTHIIRNAVDHGIETPQQRAKAGKPELGRLWIRAFHEGGQVNLEVGDDGGGIRIDRLRQKATECGLFSSEQLARMSEKEILNLIFLPGLSTATTVTNISGRGVGMDVVKTNIEKIGGSIDLQSTVGVGTTLKIKIPLTLAIVPALIVTSAGQRFAIPQLSLVELVRVESDQRSRAIETVKNTPVFRLRGNLLPLLYLNDVLTLRAEPRTDQAVNIVVLQADNRQFGLVVDEVNDTEEIVVKPLGKQIKGMSTFAGATIMGDGQVALILDVFGMARRANLATDSSQSESNLTSAARVKESGDGTQQWLVFTADKQTRMALPLGTVARLEEIPVESVEHAAGRTVVQYRGEIMPLVFLADLLGRARPVARELLQVIVYVQQGRSLGLVVDEIVDVIEDAIAVQDCGKRSGMIAASAVIQKQVTDLLDLGQVAAAAQANFGTH